MSKPYEIRRQITFTNRGEKLFGILHLPLQKEPAPCVLFFHGLAGNKVGAHRMYVAISEGLSKGGVASMRFDFRGSGDSEGAFSEMSIEGEVSDAEAAFSFLYDQPEIASEKIATFGRSFGGLISVLAAHRFKKVRGMALWAPVFDASHWEEHWEKVTTQKIDPEVRHELMRINGQLPSLDFYRELFVLSIESELTELSHVPFLHIHGEKDPLIGIEHAEQYEKMRETASAPSTFLRLPHSDHDFSHPEEKQQAIETTCQWLIDLLKE